MVRQVRIAQVMVAVAALFLLGSVAEAAITDVPRDWDSHLQQQFAALQPAPAGVVAREQIGPRKPVNMTMLLLQARDHWQELSPTTRNLVAPWLLRPTDSGGDDAYLTLDPAKVTTRDTTNFRIHYIDAARYPTDPDRATSSYAIMVGYELEAVYATEHSSLGYAAVPSDKLIPGGNNGGNGLYDVYLGNIGGYGVYGYVTFDEIYTPETATRPYGTVTYMVLDNDYTQAEFGYDNYLDPLRVTAAHEYFHAIQMGYDYQEQRAFMESCSTWMEDKVYPDIHDNYQYIGEPYTDSNDNGYYDNGEPFTDHNNNHIRDSGSVDYPELSLDSFNILGGEQYGRFLWVRFLDERYGAAVVREIWQGAGNTASSYSNDTTFQVIEGVLGNHGTTLARAFQTYAEWGYDTSQFSDGSNYPRVWMDDVQGATADFSSSVSPSLVALGDYGFPVQMHLSSVYMQINSPSGEYSFASSGGAPALTILEDSGNGLLTPRRVTLSAGSGSWTAPSGTVKAVAVVSNASASQDGMRWNLVSGSGASVPPPPSSPPPADDDSGGGGALGLPALWLLGFGLLLPQLRRRRG